MAGFENVRSLQRGLEVLQAVNRHHRLKAQDIARVTGIPRPTVYRLLETLEDMWFVLRGSSDQVWRPTLKTKSLSSGFREEHWVAQIAVPRMLRLGREVLWPLDLVTFHDFRMVVRESTHSISPYSIDHGMVGRALPLLATSGGRALIAFCDPQDRQLILDGLRNRPDEDDPLLHDDEGLSSLIARVRMHGVGFRTEGFNAHTMSISPPIIVGNRVAASLSLIWIASAMRLDEALARFAPRLIGIANEIATELSESGERGVEVGPLE
jgi:IclR family transcriptional regulator, mhp operon transcriptional activator